MGNGRPPGLRIGSLIFGSLTKVGGYQVFTYNLLRRLAERGNTVILFVPGGDRSRNAGFYDRLPFDVRSLPRPSDKLARHLPVVLRSYLRFQNMRNRFDVWQIVGSYPAAYVASTLAGKVPLVLRTHGDDIQKDIELDYGLRLDPRIEPIIRTTLSRMDRVVALTETIAENYRELEVEPDRIVEVPNGVDCARFAGASDRTATRLAWQVPVESTLLLTVGRYHRKKGYDAIPRIARMLKERGLSFVWLVVGAGTDQIDPAIQRERVTDVLHTRPAVQVSPSTDGHAPRVPDDKLVQLYQAADIFVFPSLLEGFPRVLVEAMAAGLPIVTTDAPGCREVVEHSRTAMVGPAGDAEETASLVQELVEEEGLRRRLADNALAKAREYDWDIVVDKYEELYRSMVVDLDGVRS